MNLPELPLGWQYKPIVEVMNFVKTGVSDYEGQKEYYSTSSVNEHSTSPESSVDFSSRPARANRIVEVNDVLQARLSGTDKRILISQNVEGSLFSTGFIQFRPPSPIHAEYLYLFLGSALFFTQREKLVTGSTQAAINDRNLRKIMIPMPPENEIGGIVSSFNKKLEVVENIEHRVSKAEEQLDLLRPSILKSACEGHLVPTEAALAREEGRDYESANVLLERILVERRTYFEAKNPGKKYKDPIKPNVSNMSELPEGWCWATVDQLSTTLVQGWSPKCHSYPKESDEDWGILKTTAIYPFSFDGSHHKALPNKFKPRTQLEIRRGDIIITRKGPRIRCGVSSLVRTVSPRIMVCDTTYRLRFVPQLVDLNYIEIVMNYPFTLRQIERAKSGINDSGVSLKQNVVKSLVVPLIPYDEQIRLVEHIGSLLALSESCEKQLKFIQIGSETLTQSLMNKAVTTPPNEVTR